MTGNDSDDARRAREDAEWQAIVENYGEQPAAELPSAPQRPEPEPEEFPSLGRTEIPAELAPPAWTLDDDDDRYVPPPPPPVPRPRGIRLVAWLGLFGVPTVVLISVVLGISLPSPLGLLALVWFVGGFGYLVATMNGPSDPDGGWDNGAVV